MLIYALYLTPILSHLSTNPETKCEHFEAHLPPALTFAVWFTICLVFYWLKRGTVHWIDGERLKKTPARHKEDILRMWIMQVPTVTLSGVAIRLTWDFDGLWFVAELFYFGWHYAFIFEYVKALNVNLTRQGLTSPYTLIISGVTLLVIGWNVHHHLSLLPDILRDDLFEYWLLIVGFHGLLIFGPGRHERAHLHHYHWPWLCAMICVLPTPASRTAQAMFLSCHLHGVAVFGFDPIFY